MGMINEISGQTLSYCRKKIGRDIYQYFHKNEKHRKEFRDWYFKTYGKKYRFRRLTVNERRKKYLQGQTSTPPQITI